MVIGSESSTWVRCASSAIVVVAAGVSPGCGSRGDDDGGGRAAADSEADAVNAAPVLGDDEAVLVGEEPSSDWLEWNHGRDDRFRRHL